MKLPFLFAPGASLTLNAEALPEWIQLAPYGEFPTRDKTKLQVFDAEAAAQVVSWFEFWPRKVARLMGVNAVPVWVGHPDFDPDAWPERRQVGAVKELEAREDGLWGRVAWNAEADAALRAEGHKFPSVAWDCDEINAGHLRPVMLWSVGMWHRPNIKSVQPVINAGGYEKIEFENPENGDQTKPNDMKMLKEKLMAAGLLAEGADDDAALVALEALLADHNEKASALSEAVAAEAARATAETEVNAVRETVVQREARIVELETAVTELNAARVEDALTRLIETGRITRADVETARVELNTDIDGALVKLTAKAVLNTVGLDLGGRKPVVHESYERMTRLNEWVNARMVQTNCSYDAAWEASKTAAEVADLHQQMTQADSERVA